VKLGVGWAEEVFSVLIRGIGMRGVGFGSGLPNYGGWRWLPWVLFGVVLVSGFGFRTALTRDVNAGPVGPTISATLTPDCYGPATCLHTCLHVEVISCLRSICSSFLPNDDA
jgi:hypothetical protein